MKNITGRLVLIFTYLPVSKNNPPNKAQPYNLFEAYVIFEDPVFIFSDYRQVDSQYW